MTDPRTIALYDSAAEDYAEMVTSPRPYPRLERFIDALPPAGRVLDLGCGPGNFAARMAERGLAVDALDASAGMAEVARKRYGLDVRIGSFDEVAGVGIYDGIWAHFSLLHAARGAMPGHLAALAQAMTAGGLLLLAMKLGQGEGRDRKGRLYTYYTDAELSELLATSAFEIFDRETGRDVGFDGTPHDFIVMWAQRR